MKLIRSIVSLCLAGLVLIASVGVTVNLHVCAGHVQSIALFVKAEPCQMEKKACSGVMMQMKRNGCCEDKSIEVKGKENAAEVKAVSELMPSYNFIAVILPVLYTIEGGNVSKMSSTFTQYKPPLIEHDIPVLVQSFLI